MVSKQEKAAQNLILMKLYRKHMLPEIQKSGNIGIALSKLKTIEPKKVAKLLTRLRSQNLTLDQVLGHIQGITRCEISDEVRFKWTGDTVPEATIVKVSAGSNVAAPPLPPPSSCGTPIVHSHASTILAQLVDDPAQLDLIKRKWPYHKRSSDSSEEGIVAVDCEGVPDRLLLIQVATRDAVHVFDCVKLGAPEVCAAIEGMLTNPKIVKMFHDLHCDALALAIHGGIIEPMQRTFDTQLAMEFLTNNMLTGFNSMLEFLSLPIHASKKFMVKRMNDKDLFTRRPIPSDVLNYAADDVRLLLEAFFPLISRVEEKIDRSDIVRASDERARKAREAAAGHIRQISFDKERNFSAVSAELLTVLRPEDVHPAVPPTPSDDSIMLLKLLPLDVQRALEGKSRNLCDVILDKGRQPQAWIGGERLLIGDEDRLVTKEEIDVVIDGVGGLEAFGHDNRAGMDGQLHRISVMRNRQQNPFGLTIRVGRHVEGNAYMISDLLFEDPTKSLLVLGEPGSGKTTLVRDIAKQLAMEDNVCIVDTSNEIAGDGDVPHPCVGYSRRLMVNRLDEQTNVMIECVQNHTPAVMVIDEIGRPAEVEAARTCKQRGVRLIASAHGDFRKLIRNGKLKGLVGGSESVIMGDAMAKKEAEQQQQHGKGNGSVSKLKTLRSGEPVFDLVVELSRGKPHEWRVVLDVAKAVDQVLAGQQYHSQVRMRDETTGNIQMKLE